MKITGIIAIILALFSLIFIEDDNYIRSFKNGSRTLQCNFKNKGWVTVVPDGYDDESGYYWGTKDGKGWSAKNCIIVDG